MVVRNVDDAEQERAALALLDAHELAGHQMGLQLRRPHRFLVLGRRQRHRAAMK